MIEDNELDNYNRVLAFFLFMNYNNHLDNNVEQEENIKQLKLSIQKSPNFLSEKILKN